MSQFYGWTYRDIIKLPIRAFFKFYEEAVKMEAAQFREMLDIAIVPSMKIEYYKTMRSKYNNLIYKSTPKLPPKPPEMYLPADGVEAREAMMSVFRAMKRGMGYGG